VQLQEPSGGDMFPKKGGFARQIREDMGLSQKCTRLN
jgi:hypothetical protein